MLPLSKCESYRILNIDKSKDELNHDKCEPSAMALADSKFAKHDTPRQLEAGTSYTLQKPSGIATNCPKVVATFASISTLLTQAGPVGHKFQAQ